MQAKLIQGNFWHLLKYSSQLLLKSCTLHLSATYKNWQKKQQNRSYVYMYPLLLSFIYIILILCILPLYLFKNLLKRRRLISVLLLIILCFKVGLQSVFLTPFIVLISTLMANRFSYNTAAICLTKQH